MTGLDRRRGTVLRIAHLSDPHFGTVLPSVEQALLQALRGLTPDLVIISGDITQRARRSQFAAAGRFVAALAPVPVLAIPGNHDIPLYNLPDRLFTPYRGFKRIFGEELEPTFEQHGVEVLGFNSAPRWRHKNGDISSYRVVRRLRRSETSAWLRVAVFHHPFDYVEAQDQRNLIRRNNALAQLLAAGKTDLVLGGHIHDALARTSEHRYPALARPFVIVQAGTALSWRIRYRTPNTFNLITLCRDPDTIAVERWDCDPSDQRVRFCSVAESHFCRTASGWQLQLGDDEPR